MNINNFPDVSPDEMEEAADGFFDSVHLAAPTNWKENNKLNDENSEFKAIDPLDTEREWSDEELEELTETDVKFALGSSTPGMRELLRANPNDNANS